eukprot:CAMPEP_0177530284 /NCGR_PEP_ID=MMETSP0369-20130122/53306_1 /TAXON_ID=447022 ORGANISM="Scrippsiella hangoei-like, Strain SHHI-4" /NCGR_SAMPLE_ID=MMETSP0369 /ASSEMBLY_ACC=CAM_ASM_000364 /LENGTH=67 /DNA_ID=CAMNT_0019011107 /DNA_START=63 /DNA_END=262 /DNA_ORIENTATION=+
MARTLSPPSQGDFLPIACGFSVTLQIGPALAVRRDNQQARRTTLCLHANSQASFVIDKGKPAPLMTP